MVSAQFSYSTAGAIAHRFRPLSSMHLLSLSCDISENLVFVSAPLPPVPLALIVFVS